MRFYVEDFSEYVNLIQVSLKSDTKNRQFCMEDLSSFMLSHRLRDEYRNYSTAKARAEEETSDDMNTTWRPLLTQ
jgi:hypothetical protein